MPSFGALGIGGVVALVIGAVILFDPEVAPDYSIPVSVIATVAAVSGAVMFLIVMLAMKARKRPVVSGREQLIGATGEVTAEADGGMYARIHGEVWKVRSGASLERGQMVRVTGIDGLVLAVEPTQKGERT